MSTEKWYQRPMRIGAIQWDQGEDMFKVPEVLNEGGFNVEQLLHVVSKGYMGLFNKEIHGSNLKEYIKQSEALGTKIILYFNAHVISAETFNENPGWAQRDKNGNEVSAYDTSTFACVNSGWRNLFMNTVASSLEYGISGIFLDGPTFNNIGCYCNECKRIFQDTYSYSLLDAATSAKREFKTNSIARFVKDVKDIINKSNKGVILYANTLGLAPNVTGGDIDGVYPYVDIVGTEGGFIFYTNPNDVLLWKGSQNAKYLETKAKGKPYVIFAAGDHKPWSHYMHTPEESRLLFASAVANGANVWYGIHGSINVFSTPGGIAALEFNRFLAKNEEYYHNTKRYSDIAILWSKNTIHAFPEGVEKTDFTREEDRNGNYECGSFVNEFNGFYDILTRLHAQFTIIDEKSIVEDDLSKFKLIVLPNASCLSRNECSKIEEFVKNGGNIISTYMTSFIDEKGNRYKEALLSEVFGITSVEEIYKYKDGCSYMKLENEEWLENGLSSSITAGCSRALKCKFDDSTDLLALMYYPMNGRYDEFPVKNYPSIVMKKYGNGTSIYISGGIGETYNKLGIYDIKRMIGNIITRFVNSDIMVNNAFESVEIEVRKQEESGRILIHFVNYTGYMQRPISGIVQCKDVKVTLKTDRKIRNVCTLYTNTNLDFNTYNDGVEFTVPVINEYELVVVQFI